MTHSGTFSRGCPMTDAVRSRFLLFVSLMVFVSAGWGMADREAAFEVEERILARLQEARPDFDYRDVEPTPIEGLYQVRVVGGPLLYVDEAGEHFISGELYRVMSGQFINLSERAFATERARLLDAIAEDDMIVFASATPRAVITVFTDVDCGYCRKLHGELAEYNRRGITVRYLAFPRQGMGSLTAAKMISAWCSDDSRGSLTALKNGRPIPDKPCAGHPVERQFNLGRELGVRGTPAIILADGTMIPGYQSAADLAKILGLE